LGIGSFGLTTFSSRQEFQSALSLVGVAGDGRDIELNRRHLS
jgi:hypothetical protein